MIQKYILKIQILLEQLHETNILVGISCLQGGGACLFLMNNYEDSEIINIGTGEDLTIKELAYIIRDVVGVDVTVQFDSSKVDLRILNHASISFSQNVIRNGRVILDRDSNLKADFEGLTLKSY